MFSHFCDVKVTLERRNKETMVKTGEGWDGSLTTESELFWGSCERLLTSHASDCLMRATAYPTQPWSSLQAAGFFSEGHWDACLVIANVKGQYGSGRVGKKGGQGRYDRVGKKARREKNIFSSVPRPCLVPFPLSQNVSPHNPYWISREKQTASSLPLVLLHYVCYRM